MNGNLIVIRTSAHLRIAVTGYLYCHARTLYSWFAFTPIYVTATLHDQCFCSQTITASSSFPKKSDNENFSKKHCFFSVLDVQSETLRHSCRLRSIDSKACHPLQPCVQRDFRIHVITNHQGNNTYFILCILTLFWS